MTKRTFNLRQVLRVIRRRFPDAGPWMVAKDEMIEDSRAVVLVNPQNRMIGVLDRGDNLAIYDNANPEDTPEHPTYVLKKGKKLRPI